MKEVRIRAMAKERYVTSCLWTGDRAIMLYRIRTPRGIKRAYTKFMAVEEKRLKSATAVDSIVGIAIYTY